MHLYLFFFSLLIATTVNAQSSVGEDINNLIDRFFGEGQEPVEELIEAPTINPLDIDASEVRQSIQLEESILDSFTAEVEEREAALWDLTGQKNTIEQQLELLDQQISFDTEKIETYRVQEEKWQETLALITSQKTLLESALRAEKADYQTLMAQTYIRAQNLGSDDKVTWWEWLFSSRSVSQIIESRAQQKQILTQKKNSLKTLEQLKFELEARERQASLVYSHVNGLSDQLHNDRQQLTALVTARANLLSGIARDKAAEEKALAAAQRERRESTEYLVQLRDQLRVIPESPRAETAIDTDVTEIPDSVLQWPLTGKIRVTAGFRDPDYADALGREHDGLDLFAPQGSSVIAPANGVVEKVATNGYGYSYLILAHKDGLYTVFGHLSEILVEPEEVVYIGKEIAKSGGTPGTTGAGYFTTGPHLHLETFKDGNFLDPLTLLPSLK